MKCALLLVCLFLTCLHLQAKDLVVGSRVNNLLVSTEKVVYRSIPLLRRDKDYVYVDKKQRIIKGIIARDLSRTQTEVTVTSGGVGSMNVTLHFQSGRGEGINYLVLIFSLNS